MSHNITYKTLIKRMLDASLSLMACVVLSPLLLITAILVRVKLGTPVIFKQARPGKDERIFHLYKFRSMTNEVGEDGRLLPDDQRLTKFGKFLRASSLDELPELINILKGDMSIVGPRPLSIYYLPHYPSTFRRRHEVRPGLTGYAQINGRNNINWDDRFSYDLKYVENVSFLLDVKIISNTVMKVLKHADVTVRGANQIKDYGTFCVLKEESRGGIKVNQMTYSEIGSYFWLENKPELNAEHEITWLPEVYDSSFAFSGRNAIDIALRDILHEKKIDTVYVPSYSCISMLQAFIDRGMKVEFYQVGFESGMFTYRIPETDEHSVVLIMSYFGLATDHVHDQIREIHKKGSIVIEDITHSLLRRDSASDESDYVVASLRKWFAIPSGGWIGKRNGSLAEKPSMDSNHAVKQKISAMHDKYAYLTGKINSKEAFLEAQATFENDLIHVDRLLKIDDTSLRLLIDTNVENVIAQRRTNARILIEGLGDMAQIMDFPDVDLNMDVPLFLPVFLKTNLRDSLREFLINKGIYCPIHWPEVMGAPAGVRENEISLICDQRYSEGDMLAIVDAIHEWYKSTH